MKKANYKCFGIMFRELDHDAVEQAIITKEQIKIDMTYDEEQYTVILNKISENRFRGEATHRVTQTKIDIAAKVYFEDDNNEIIIVGTKWIEGGVNYNWCLMLENID